MKYKVNKGFITQKLDGKTVIFDGEQSVLFTFNETASLIFQKLKVKWTKEKIVSSLVKKYAVSQQRAEKDFDTLIRDLLNKKIISQ